MLSTYVLPVPLSSTPFQLPVKVHLLTDALEPSNTLKAPDTVLGVILRPAQHPDVVDSEVGDVADEETVLDGGATSVE